MGFGYTKTTILGNVGSIETGEIPGGTSYATVSVGADVRRYDSDADEYYDETEWHRLTAYGQQANYLARRAQKGSVLFAEAEQDSYTIDVGGEEVQKSSYTVKSAHELQVLDDGGSPPGPKEEIEQESASSTPSSEQQTGEDGWFETDDDELPF
jgi:single-stranded DNA-binding protein